MPADPSRSDQSNSFGRLTTVYNQDPSGYLSRASGEVCGVPGGGAGRKWAGCAELGHALEVI